MWGDSKTNVVYAVGANDATVRIYCDQYNGLNIANGAGFVETNYQGYAKCLQAVIGINGITVVLDKSAVDVVALVKKLHLNQTFSQQTEDFSCIYGYTSKIRGYTVVDGQKVNVQIAVTPTNIYVGSPLLLGSY